MANYRRKKPKTTVRCTLCTPNRLGNAKAGKSIKQRSQEEKVRDQIRTFKNGSEDSGKLRGW